MANEYAVNQADLLAVADAIREKSGTSDMLSFPDGFVDAVSAIRAGGDQTEEIQFMRGIVEDTLTELVSPHITRVATYTFRGHKSLTKIDLPNCTYVDNDAFNECSNVTEIRMESFESGERIANPFTSMTSLQTVYMPNCVYAPAIINAPNLKNVTYSPNIHSLYGNAFERTGIEEAIFPTVTAMYNSIFNGCPHLKKVDVNNSKWYVENSVCKNASSLETFIMRSTTFCRLGGTGAFSGTPIEAGTGYIYVPAALVEEYKAATNWTLYADQIRAIEDYPEITGG